jgi:hypothetical protein
MPFPASPAMTKQCHQCPISDVINGQSTIEKTWFCRGGRDYLNNQNLITLTNLSNQYSLASPPMMIRSGAGKGKEGRGALIAH